MRGTESAWGLGTATQAARHVQRWHAVQRQGCRAVMHRHGRVMRLHALWGHILPTRLPSVRQHCGAIACVARCRTSSIELHRHSRKGCSPSPGVLAQTCVVAVVMVVRNSRQAGRSASVGGAVLSAYAATCARVPCCCMPSEVK